MLEPTTCPRSFTAPAMLFVRLNPFRYRIPKLLLQPNAVWRSVPPLTLNSWPTTTPVWFIPRPALLCQPESTPRSCIPPPAVHKKAPDCPDCESAVAENNDVKRINASRSECLIQPPPKPGQIIHLSICLQVNSS